MSRLGLKDLAIVGVFFVGALLVVISALTGHTDWAIAIIGLMFAGFVLVNRADSASRRAALTGLRDRVRDVQRRLDAQRTPAEQPPTRVDADVAALSKQVSSVGKQLSAIAKIQKAQSSTITREVTSLRPEIRGMRVAQQLLITANREAGDTAPRD